MVVGNAQCLSFILFSVHVKIGFLGLNGGKMGEL